MAPAARSTFVVYNMHCASCVSTINGALNRLQPKPVSISISIISQTVVVERPLSLSEKSIEKALEDIGFDVEIVSSSSASYVESHEHEVDRGWFGAALERVTSFGRATPSEEDRRSKHLETCAACRDEALRVDSTTTTPLLDPESTHRELTLSINDGSPAETVVEDDRPFSVAVDSQHEDIGRAVLYITNIPSSSHLDAVSKVLKRQKWVLHAEVNTLKSTVTVEFLDRTRLEEIFDIIKDEGYDANIDEFESISSPKESASVPQQAGDLWHADYAVDGMTCSSCVASITRALVPFKWIRNVQVNLVSNSATVVFEGKDHLPEIAEAIEAHGYDANLTDWEKEGQHSTEMPSERRVLIRIDGMFCQHCPDQVIKSLEPFDQVVINRHPEISNPILDVTYTPSAPGFTIRNILGSISTASAAFKPAIYHPLTVEERSKRIIFRQRQQIINRLILSVVIAIPTFIFGIVFMTMVPSNNRFNKYLMQPFWFGRATRLQWILFALATPVYFLAADIFHYRTFIELRALWGPGSKTPVLQRFIRFGSMDMLISLGSTVAYGSSLAILIIDSLHSPSLGWDDNGSYYFDAVVFLTMFLLTGRLLEVVSKAKAGDAVTMLGKLRPSTAILIEPVGFDTTTDTSNGPTGIRQVPIDLLESGDSVRVLNGASPPGDGVITEGETKFDESSLTGESRLVSKGIGNEVFSGTVNKGAPITVKITSISGTSMLDQIVSAVREGQTRRAPIEHLADTITSYFVPIVTLLAVLTWIVWLTLGLSGALPKSYLDTPIGGWPFWSLQFAIAVFLIACPCGIGLAAPTALFIGGGLAARNGILVKGGGEAFQEASTLDCIVFDKTGTLTEGGEPAITDEDFSADPDFDAGDILHVVRKVEESSSHPLAKALVSYCNGAGIEDLGVLNIEEIAGKGMRGEYAKNGLNREILVGNEALVHDFGVSIEAGCIDRLSDWKSQGKSVILAAIKTGESGFKLAAMFAAADPIRPEARSVILALRSRGIDVWMLSGDNKMTADAVGEMVGIPASNIIAGVLPDQKADKIIYLQKSQHKRSSHGESPERAIVAMVGDGINDSPALTVADVGASLRFLYCYTLRG
jgi:P-type Cu+ transporter